MKPLYLTITTFFPSPFHSREYFIFDQVKTIQKSGIYEMIVLKPKSLFSKEKDYTIQGIRVFYFKTFILPSGIMPGVFNFISCWYLKRKLKSIGIEIQNIEIVHSHVNSLGIYANALKKVNAKIKTIVQHHGFDILSLQNGILRNFKWHRRWVENYGVSICNRIDLHIGVSVKTLEQLKKYPKIKIKNSFVLYNGVDEKRFYPILSSKNSNYFTIGCIGSFWALKDQITLIKAFLNLINKGVLNLRLKLVGTGVTLLTCKEFVNNNNLTEYVEFIDKIPHNQLLNFYNQLDLFVLPSYYEAFGCVYTEAYACGVPFIGVKGQGIEEIILPEERVYWLINKEDVGNLSQLILDQMLKPRIQKLVTPITLQETIADYINYLKSHHNAI